MRDVTDTMLLAALLVAVLVLVRVDSHRTQRMLRRIMTVQDNTRAGLDAQLVTLGTDIQAIGTQLAANTALLQKLSTAGAVPDDFTTEVNELITDNTALSTDIAALAAADAAPGGVPGTPPSTTTPPAATPPAS